MHEHELVIVIPINFIILFSHIMKLQILIFLTNNFTLFACFRLSKSHILVCGMKGTVAEVILNLLIFIFIFIFVLLE